MCEVLDKYINQGLATGRSEIQMLMKSLFSEGRVDDLRRASTDDEYLTQLLAEQHLLAEQGGVAGTAAVTEAWQPPRAAQCRPSGTVR